jgi:hypothetical protein
MGRIFRILCVLATAALPARAQQLDLKPPRLSAHPTCTPLQRARCAGMDEQALAREAACAACSQAREVVTPTPSEDRVTTESAGQSPSRPPDRAPAKSEQPLLCALGEMPLGPRAPGCVRPPLDALPPR